MSVPRRVLCLPGSLRRVSSNRALLQAAAQLAPPALELSVYEGMAALPLFNPDLEIEPLPKNGNGNGNGHGKNGSAKSKPRRATVESTR